MRLRPYQHDACGAVRDAWRDHERVSIEMATGLGKTVIFSHLAAGYEGRSMVICPQLPLIGQARDKLQMVTGETAAIEQAENSSAEHCEYMKTRFVVASKQTLTTGKDRKRWEKFRDIGLVIVDEAHLAGTELYAQMLSHFTDLGAKVLGVSATLKRHDKKAMGQVFDSCCYRYGIVDAIPDGWLVNAKCRVKRIESMDLSKVESRKDGFGASDFIPSQLAKVLEDERVVFEIAEAVRQETAGEKTAIFCSSVGEARAVAEYLSDTGVRADWICADPQKCSKQRRAEVMRSFHDPDGITHLANVGILTTGWDYPELKNIVMARPTKSLPLYTQIFGRGPRPLPGVVDGPETAEERRAAIAASAKPYFRMIDLVDASLDHKIVTTVDVLGGEHGLAVRQKAAEKAADADGDVDAAEITAEAAEEVAKSQLEEMWEACRQYRAQLCARATFNDVDVDPFGRRTGRVKGRVNGEPATPEQLRYLWVLGYRGPTQGISKRQASGMIGKYKGGR